MRRHKWKLLALVGLVLAGVSAFATWPRPDRITEENYFRIKQGMSRTEVEAILGPPGDYRNGPTTNAGPEYLLYRRSRSEDWRGDTGVIRIEFDDSGRVTWVDFGSDYRVDRVRFLNPLEQAKWQWRRWFP